MASRIAATSSADVISPRSLALCCTSPGLGFKAAIASRPCARKVEPGGIGRLEQAREPENPRARIENPRLCVFP